MRAQQQIVRPLCADDHRALAHQQPGIHGLADARPRVLFDRDPVDHHLDIVSDIAFQFRGLGQRRHSPIHAHADVPLLLQILKQIAVLPFAALHQRRHDVNARALAQCHDAIHDAIARLRPYRRVVIHAMRRAHPRKQHAQVVVDFRDRAHSRSGVAPRGLLLDRNRRRQARDLIHFGLFHLPQKLPRIRR